MSIGDLLQGLMGAAGEEPASEEPEGAGDSLAGALSALLGGSGLQTEAQPEAAQAETAAGSDLNSMFNSLLGGGQQSGASGGGMGGMLGALLGGGSTSGASGSSALVDALAEKIGIPPAIAQLIVTFVLGKLQGSLGQRGADVSGMRAVGELEAADLSALLQQMSGDRSMAAELAAQTGLDSRTAMKGMQEAIKMIRGHAE